MQMRIEKSWFEVLKDELSLPYIQELKVFLADEEKKGAVVYPPQRQVFNAFLKTPWEQVKVVIIGQDPYHGAHQAHGLSFSVVKGIPIPPSLKNIYKELESDLKIKAPEHGSLERWAEQGVLLLNATLTVRAGLPQSHQGKGWETFTDAVVRKLAERKDPLVFLLWGRFAKEKCQNILSQIPHNHAVFTAAHPSPFSAKGFLGCRHFSKANECLQRWGKTAIDWSLN